MASDIVSSARLVAGLLEDLAGSPDPAFASNLDKAARKLQKDLTLIQTHIKGLASNKATERKTALQAIRKLRPSSGTTTETLISGGDSQGTADPAVPMKIDAFFEQVSDAVVNAQSRLNNVSLEYVRNLDPRIAPAYFTIPTLKAELKVGFQSSKSTGLNLILFSSAEDKQAYGESTVTFELAATPPPPGATPAGELAIPTPRFLMLGEQRRRLLTIVRQLAENQGKKLGATFDNTERNDLAQVIRFERQPDDLEAQRTRYLVLWPSQQTGTKDHTKWRELLVAPLVVPQNADFDKVDFDPGFPFLSDPPFLVLTSKDPGDDGNAKLAADLGATLNCVAVAIRDWAQTMRLSTVLPPIPPTQP